jgi:3-phenylpropionate/trans-cinnamate dioxygenase ferredoxin component
MNQWIEVCALESMEDEDVKRFDHEGKIFAIYRLGNDAYATAGLCTHEKVHLCDGLVMNAVIECPKHSGRFDIRTGRALGAPVCEALATYPTSVEDGMVRIQILPR